MKIGVSAFERRTAQKPFALHSLSLGKNDGSHNKKHAECINDAWIVKQPSCKHEFRKLLLGGVTTAMCLSLQQPMDAHAQVEAPQLFSNTCAGCHAGGGNIVNRSATLRFDDLEKNGVSGADKLFEVIYYGKGSMPGYGEDCQPKGKCTFGKRLTNDEVQALAKYVEDQAKAGWTGE